MTPERWQQIEELFQTVVEIPATKRKEYLTQVCAGDDELRREVQSLLKHEVFDTFIQEPILDAVQSLSFAAGDDLAGQRFGHYRVTALLGVGGMGVVYAAVRDDEQFVQRVAIKIVKLGMDSGVVLSRFHAERRILASLDHPNIARLFDGGSTADGRPYFVMEFIEGQSLNDYCAAQKLSIADRVKLFRQVCSAVQYAHQKLVIHRDIKPGNILVNQDGVAKLLDFGIARLLAPAQSEADPARTATMMRMMTPDYASPEQVRGTPFTTATDVYSLGAVLYELLTGQRPHRLQSYTPTEIERNICETEIVRPSEAASKAVGLPAKRRPRFLVNPAGGLAGDLDNIILMAMRKEPERRYASVEQFSDDLRRYLEKLPVMARADTFRYRAGKFVRRHKAGVMATALAIISLLGGLIAANYQARRAERRFQQVRKLANTFLFDVHDEMRKLPGSTKARALVVNTALEYLDNLSQETSDDPALQLELAQAYERVGAVQGYPFDQNLGQSAAALASFQKALAIYTRLAVSDPFNQKLLEALGNLHVRIGDLHTNDGRGAEIEQSFREAMRVVEKMAEAKIEASPFLATAAHHRAGELARRGGDLQAALRNQRRAFEIAVDWAAKHPSDSSQSLMLINYSRLGGALLRLGDLDGALDAYNQSLRIGRELAAQFPESAYYRQTLLSRYQAVADVLGDPDDPNLGRAEEALAHYRTALAMAEELSAADPNNAQARRDMGLASLWVAMMMRDSAPAQAAGLYRKSLAISDALCQSAPENIQFRHELALAHRGLGHALWRLNQPHQALISLRKALELQQANFALDPVKTWAHRGIRRTYAVIGNVLLDQGDTDGALDNYRRAMTINEKLLAIHPADIFLRRDQAYCYESFGHFHATLAKQRWLAPAQQIAAGREACDWYQRSLQIWNEWLSQGLAPAYGMRKRDEATRELAACESALRQITTATR